MEINREELTKKAMKAASAEEVMEIVRAAGEEITAEEAKQFFEKVQERKTDKALSLDELDAVTGGEEFSLVRWGITFRDYSREGCAATVEPDSHCWGTDGGCIAVDRVYSHKPIWVKCPDCGVYLYKSGESYGRCIVCGKGYSLEVSGPRIGSLN